MFTRIDHVGIAVASIDDELPAWQERFGMEPSHRETVEEQGVEAVLFDVGENHVELIAPLGPETGVARFIESRGPGLHHVAWQVEDIDAVLAQLKESGVRLIDEEPRTGIRGSRVAFIHPKSAGGVLTEIVEPAEGSH
jgi:methylmalonyl-CoA/ethylmalonyl-CoA epimerase